MKNNKKISLKKIIIFVSCVLLSAGVATGIILGITSGKSKNTKLPDMIGNKTIYDSAQVAVSESAIETSDVISISTCYTGLTKGSLTVKTPTLGTNTYITIKNEEELYAFSLLCKQSTSFLGYKYELISDIDYSENSYAASRPFYPIGYSTAFTGIFNGNGYEISNLKLYSSSTLETDLSGITYYAMFSHVGTAGKVTNFGLVDPVANPGYTATGSLYYASYMIGLNEGKVNYTYVRNLTDPEKDNSTGISASGGWGISALMYENKGNFTDSYTELGTVQNINCTDFISVAEILMRNSGTESNLYFYNKSIATSGITYEGDSGTTTADEKFDKAIDNKTIKIKYRDYIGRTYNILHFGYFCGSTDYLMTNVKKDNASWYVPSDYGTYSGKVTNLIKSPTTRGIAGFSVDNGNATVTISSLSDYEYMFVLMNANSDFAGKKFTYNIACDINLALLPSKSYSYSGGIAATIQGVKNASGYPSAVTFSDTTVSKYPTIYDPALEEDTLTEGYECYGVFNHVNEGTVQNLNVVYTSSKTVTGSSNIIVAGGVVGYLDGGTIDNVNVFTKGTASIKVNNSNRYHLGGIVGMVGGKAVIKNSTTNASLSSTAGTNSASTKVDGIAEITMGGIAGYLTSTGASINTCLSLSDITCGGASDTSSSVCVGGIAGAGYFEAAANLQNEGAITVSSGIKASSLYVSGLIGRLLGSKTEITLCNNFGDVTVNATSAATTYVSGLMNADIQTSGTVNSYKHAGKYYLQASGLANGADISVDGAQTSLKYTSGIYVKSNNYISQLTGIYNVSYNEVSTASGKTKLSSASVTMNYAPVYAGVVYAEGTTSTYDVELNTVYNLRDVNYTQTASLGTNLNYCGVVYGLYINYTDVRNEGNQTFTFDTGVGSSAASYSIKIAGVFQEVSGGFSAETIYNGGNITVDYKTKDIYADIYTAGICYANRASSSLNTDKYNPSKDDFDANAKGSLNNVINSGTIKVSSSDFSSVDYSTYYVYISSNESTFQAGVHQSSYSKSVLYGNIYASGIVSVNESVITNTFNIADVYAANYIKDIETTREVNACGIAYLNSGSKAYIENSANDGDITAINFSTDSYTTGRSVTWSNSSGALGSNYVILESGGLTEHKSEVNSAGIVCRNDKSETGNYISSTTNPNTQQVISFTINYGSVYAYDFTENIRNATDTLHSKAAGIMAVGLCNVINVTNYGNIYGSEISAGIFGNVSLDSFSTEIASNNIALANLLNYGNVYVLMKGYNSANGNGFGDIGSQDVSVPANYAAFSQLSDYKSVSNGNAVTPNTNVIFKYYAGSIIGIIDYNSSANADNITIRYLVSFDDDIAISGIELNVPSGITVDTTTIFSPYTTTVSSYISRDKYLNTNVQYAALSTGSETGIFLKGNSLDSGTATMTFQNVFSSTFPFRKAINNQYEDGTTYTTPAGVTVKYYDTANHPTDAFLTDYFQFVSYNYVNDILISSIGWKTIAYLDAANTLANSLDGTYLFYTYYKGINSTTYNTDLSAALKTETWSEYASEEVLNELLLKLVDENNLEQTNALLEYLFSDECVNSTVIDSTFRANIVSYVMENYPDAITNADLLFFENGYSDTLSTVLSSVDSKDTTDIKNDVKEAIDEFIKTSADTSKERLLLSYVEYLYECGDDFFSNTSQSARYNLLNNLFSSYDNDDALFTRLITLFSTSNQTIISNFSDAISVYGGYSKLTSSEKYNLFVNIISQNTASELGTYLDTFASEIGLFDELKANGYDINSFSEIESGASTTTSSTTSAVIDKRIELWNQIKDTSTFTSYFSGKYGSGVKYYLATEANNTYQSISAPVVASNMANQASIYKNEKGVSSDLNFIYTTTVTPDTYFYGPYTNSSGGTTSATTNKAIGSTTSGYVNVTTNTLYSVFISSEDISNGNYTYKSVATNNSNGITTVSSNPLVFMRRLDGTQIDTLGLEAYDGKKRPGLSYYTINTDDYVLSNGVKISLDKVIITRPTATGPAFTLNGTSINNAITVVSNGTETAVTQANAWYYLVTNYVYNLHFSTVNTNWHSTAQTGIYVIFDPTWSQYGVTQQGILYGSGKTDHIQTTQYIDYDYEQVLKLDGFYSTYEDGTTKCDDERNIINSMFNTYFVSDSTFADVVKKALLESLEDSSDTSFVDSWMQSNINSDTLINSEKPLVYLNCNLAISDSTDATNVSEYLSSKNTVQGNKAKIMNAASGNIEVFTELLRLLFDNSMAVGADPDWSPTDSSGYDGWGSSLDIYSLYMRHNLIYEAKGKSFSAFGATGFEKVETFGSDGSLTNGYQLKGSNFYMPLRVSNDTSATSTYYTSATTETVDSTTNPGYLVGSKSGGSKFEVMHQTIDLALTDNATNSTSTSTSGSGATYDADGNLTDIQLWTKQNSTSSDSDCVTADSIYGTGGTLASTRYSDVKSSLIKTINNNSNYLYALSFTGSKPDGNNYVTISKAVIYGQEYTNYKIPYNTLSFYAKEDGYICFVGFTYGRDWSNLFNIYKYNPTNYSTDLNSSQLSNVYASQPDSSGNITISTSSGTNMNLYYSSSWGQLPKGKLFYYEIPVEAGYNYVIGNANNGDCMSLVYLDLGINGTKKQTTTEDQVYYVQKLMADLDGINKYLDSLITYMVSLDSMKHSYTVATSFAANTVYYTRSGSGTAADPYVYRVAEVTSSTFSSGTYYTCDNDTGMDTYIRRYVQASSYSSSKDYYSKVNRYGLASSVTKDNYKNYYTRSGSGTTADPYVYTTASSYSSDVQYYAYIPIYLPATGVTDSNYSDYYVVSDSTYTLKDFQDFVFDEDFMEKMASSSRKATLGLIEGISSVIGENDVLTQMVDYSSKMFDSTVIYYSTDADKYTNTYKQYLMGGYLATDYYHNYETDMKNTILYQRLSDLSEAYHYITGAITIDNDKFKAFCDVISYDLNSLEFGIFALAANTGIQNGAFIPDNVVLSQMDPLYKLNASNYYEISDNITYYTEDGAVGTTNASWRVGKASYEDSDDKTVSGSVNYAFYVEMKQLKKSISTVVFELDLDYDYSYTDSESNTINDSTTFYSSEDLIDYENHTITYYVPKSFISYLSAGSQTATVDNIDLANLAKAYKNSATWSLASSYAAGTDYYTRIGSEGNYSYSGIELTKDTFTANKYYVYTPSNSQITDGYTPFNLDDGTLDGYTYTLAEAFIVYAEDKTVSAKYDIIFIGMDIDYSLAYDTGSSDDGTITVSTSSATVDYKDGYVVLSVAPYTDSDGNKYQLPKGLDLSKYLYIADSTGNKMDDAFTLSAADGDHIVDASGNSTITMYIETSLPAATYSIVLKVFDVSESVTLIKNPSTEAELTLVFDGNEVEWEADGTNFKATSDIEWGRAYNYAELYSADILTKAPSYLTSLAISDNATITMSPVTKSGTDIMTYTITYVVTSESGTEITYTHNLKEKTPYADDAEFITVFKDGDTLGTGKFNQASVQSFTDEDGNVVMAISLQNITAISFERGSEPQYRARYSLLNFYTDGITSDNFTTTGTAGGASYGVYGGMVAYVSDTSSTGVYMFTAKYTNSGKWDGDVSYDRTYAFPNVVITKAYSEDALLKSITFLDKYIVEGADATVVYPENSILPDKTQISGTVTEIDYNELRVTASDAQVMSVSQNATINYHLTDNTDYSTNEYNDYYIIGTTSDADLSHYAPTFKIDDYAEIYQYTTKTKLTKYGSGNNQSSTTTDASILGVHTDNYIYLYVPFYTGSSASDDVSANQTIFIVQYNLTTKKIGYVYTDSYTCDKEDATSTSYVASATTALTGKSLAEMKSVSFTVTDENGNDTAYKCSSYAGMPNSNNNSGLFMDYIGTPAENRFWYVSYVVLSESYMNSTSDAVSAKYYHVSIIDLTNSVYFKVKVNAPLDFKDENGDLITASFLTMAYTKYAVPTEFTSGIIYYERTGKGSSTEPYEYKVTADTVDSSNYKQYYIVSTGTISADVVYTGEKSGYRVYELDYNMQLMPYGYYEFYLDLPNGYVVSYTADKNGTPDSAHKDCYLPIASIVTQTVELTFSITEADQSVSTDVWALKISSYNSVQATKPASE